MKSLALFTTLALTFFALTSEAFSGFVNKVGADYFFTESGSKVPYRVVTQDPDVTSTVKRLAAGDMVSGNGTLDPVHRTLIVHSLDFVGLRRLLGPWLTGDGFLVFKDFNNLTVQTLNGQRSHFSYSLTPSEGDEWVLFLSDARRTIMATLHFETEAHTPAGKKTKKRASMKIFESETGTVLRTLDLERP